MRPIDADVLIPLIQEDKIEGKILDIVKALGDGLQAETLNQACDRHIKMINDLPTIDVVPVVHGKWDCSTGLPTCTACGKMPRKFYIDGSEKWSFCPNCGARMEGWKDDE